MGKERRRDGAVIANAHQLRSSSTSYLQHSPYYTICRHLSSVCTPSLLSYPRYSTTCSTIVMVLVLCGTIAYLIRALIAFMNESEFRILFRLRRQLGSRDTAAQLRQSRHSGFGDIGAAAARSVCASMCMCVCVCVCVYCMYVCMYVCVYVSVYVSVYIVCMYVCMYVCVCILYVCMYVCICMYVYVSVYIVCMYVCMYSLTEVKRDTVYLGAAKYLGVNPTSRIRITFRSSMSKAALPFSFALGRQRSYPEAIEVQV